MNMTENQFERSFARNADGTLTPDAVETRTDILAGAVARLAREVEFLTEQLSNVAEITRNVLMTTTDHRLDN